MRARGVVRRPFRTGRRGERGQSFTETLVALTIVLAIFFGLLHLSLLAVTRHVCNYAAFAGARAAMYGEAADAYQASAAANDVTRMLGRGTDFVSGSSYGATFRVQVRSPFSYALFNNSGGAKVIVQSEAPMVTQSPVPKEGGDNASSR